MEGIYPLGAFISRFASDAFVWFACGLGAMAFMLESVISDWILLGNKYWYYLIVIWDIYR